MLQESEKEVDINMAYPIASGMAESVGANTKSSNLVTGRNQFIPKGTLTLIALGSATGMLCSLSVAGVSVIDDLDITFFGTTGTMSSQNNVVAQQDVAGGVVEFFLRNGTAGTLTTDFQLLFTPTR